MSYVFSGVHQPDNIAIGNSWLILFAFNNDGEMNPRATFGPRDSDFEQWCTRQKKPD